MMIVFGEEGVRLSRNKDTCNTQKSSTSAMMDKKKWIQEKEEMNENKSDVRREETQKEVNGEKQTNVKGTLGKS